MVWWLAPVIPTLGRLREGDSEFEVSLGNIVKSLFQIHKNKQQLMEMSFLVKRFLLLLH